MPAVLFTDLPETPEAAADVLGLSPEQLTDVRDGALQADLDVPSGAWRVWPQKRVAAWLGRSTSSPHTSAALERAQLDLVDALDRLYERGYWCAELQLLRDEDGWSGSLPLKAALSKMIDGEQAVRGFSGVFGDGRGGSARVELLCDGQAWASSSIDAERWLLVASGLSDE